MRCSKHWAAVVGASLELAGGVVGDMLRRGHAAASGGCPCWSASHWCCMRPGGSSTGDAIASSSRTCVCSASTASCPSRSPRCRSRASSTSRCPSRSSDASSGYGHSCSSRPHRIRACATSGSSAARMSAGLTIQRVIAQAGLRGYAGPRPVMDDGMGTPPMPPMPPAPPAPRAPAERHRALRVVRPRSHDDEPHPSPRADRRPGRNIGGGPRVLIPWSVTRGR